MSTSFLVFIMLKVCKTIPGIQDPQAHSYPLAEFQEHCTQAICNLSTTISKPRQKLVSWSMLRKSAARKIFWLAICCSILGHLCLQVACIPSHDFEGAKCARYQALSLFKTPISTCGKIKGERGKASKGDGSRENLQKVQMLRICRGVGVFPSRVIQDEYRM